MNQNSRPNRDLSRRQLLQVLRHRRRCRSRQQLPRGVRRRRRQRRRGRRRCGQQSSGGILIHGATGGGSKDTLDPHAPVTNPDIARVSNLYEPLLFWNNNYELEPALAESVEGSKDAKTWTIKMRQGVTFHNGKDVTAEDAWFSIQRVSEPEGAAVGGRPALHDPRLRGEQGGRPDHPAARAEGAVRAARLAAGGVHARHHPDRLRHREPRRHRCLRLQVLRPRQDQHLHQVRRLLGRRGVRRRAADPGLQRRQRQGQRPAGGADPDGRQPALQPHRHHQGCRRRRPGLRDRRVGALHHARRLGAVLRRPRPPGDAPDRRPPADDRPDAERLRHARQRHVRAVRRGVRQRPAPARAGHRPGQVAAGRGRPGGAAGRALHRRRHRLGRPGRGQPVRRAGQGRRRRRQGHQEDPVLRRPVPVLPVRAGLLEHPQLHPAGRGGHLPAGPGRHLQRDPLGQPAAPRPGQPGGPGARRDQAGRPAPPGAGDRVQRGRPDHLGLPPAGRRLRRQRPGPRAEQYLPLGSYKFNKVSVS